MSQLSGACRGAFVAVLCLLASAASAQATTTIQFATDSGSRGAGGTTAQLIITGNGENNQVTLQRVQNDDPGNPGLTNTDLIKITDPTGAVRIAGAPGSDSADFCKDIPGENAAACYIHDAASDVRTDTSTLGDGNDTLTVVPAATGGEIDVEMNGGNGDDRLVGASGRDTFMGGNGSDTMLGNGGADFFSDVGATPGEIDTVDYNDSAHTSTGVNVNLNDGNSNDGTDGVDGTFAGDQVGIGIDKVVGTDFNDFLFGSAADETLVGGLGKDGLIGQDGNDRIEARDSAADSSVECGDGNDVAITDSNDPATVGCETEDRTAAPGGGSTTPTPTTTTAPITTPAPGLTTFATQSERLMPDLRRSPFSGLSIDAMQTELRKTLWVALDAQPLDFAQAASRAGRANIRPYDVIAQSPNAGAPVSGTANRLAKVKVFFWDPAKDAVKQPCNSKAVLRANNGRGDRVKLLAALRGMEFREGKSGDEGEAQDVLRRVGCQYDAKITYSAKAKSATVKTAKPATLKRAKRINGRVQVISVKGFELQVTAPRNGNDFLTTFTEPLTLRGNELPLSTALQLPTRFTFRAEINVRETATGRIAEGTLVELSAPGGEVIASGRTGTDGMVSLTGFIAAKGTYELYLSRQRNDPATGEVVRQEGILELTAVQPKNTWKGVAGTAFKRTGSGKLFTRGGAGLSLRQSAAGAGNFAVQMAIDISKAQGARALADVIAAKAGLSAAERDALASKYAALFGVANDSPANALFGIRRAQLLPGIGATKAGKLCATYKAPEIKTVNAAAIKGASGVVGKAEGANFDCGRAVLIDPTTGLTLAGPNNVLGGKLIANDGASIISDHGAGIVSNSSGSLIANDGASLIANDGASLVPVTNLLANDGASLIANDGASFQPIGGGTTFQPAGR